MTTLMLSTCKYFGLQPKLKLKSSITAVQLQVPPVALLPNCIVQQKVLYPFRKQVGGTILAAKLAKERGWAINVGGGFHHCCADKGGGFCVYADISLCIMFAFTHLNISRVMIIDLDAIPTGRVYILDMYTPDIYPFDFKARTYIDQSVEIQSGNPTEVYLEQLDKALEVAGNCFDPELVVYNAGTECWKLIYIHYDAGKSNAEFALDYGFVESRLDHNAYTLTLGISDSDPFLGDKSDIAESNSSSLVNLAYP